MEVLACYTASTLTKGCKHVIDLDHSYELLFHEWRRGAA